MQKLAGGGIAASPSLRFGRRIRPACHAIFEKGFTGFAIRQGLQIVRLAVFIRRLIGSLVEIFIFAAGYHEDGSGDGGYEQQ